MPDRRIPYGAFNFQVNFGGSNPPDQPSGGFSDVSGLNTELMVAEYRTGVDVENHVRKVAGLHKTGDVTLKRGIINSKDLWDWIEEVRSNGSLKQRDVTVTLYDEAHQAAMSWTLRGCVPMKWTGPTFAAKAHGDVAMEELVLSVEGIVLNT